MAKTRARTVNEYLASKPKEARPILEGVRRAIRKAVPAAEEGLAYQMAAYTLNGVPVLYFAGWKAHYSLYPINDALVAAFERELAPYERSKGAVRFPLDAPAPARLIERIAKFRARQITSRDKPKGGRPRGRVAQLERLRRLMRGLPNMAEKISHGTPSFFVEQDGDTYKGCFAMFSDHHHDDGRLALWVPVAHGLQAVMIDEAPKTYFMPPYVGGGGWIGIDLAHIQDDALKAHLREAWNLIVAKMKRSRRPRARTGG
jgi:uncharacterized protein YdhG (YjbR/CyaY superfamily)